MKLFIAAIGAILSSVFALAQPPSYTVTDLGTLPGGTFSQATYVNNSGLLSGVAATSDGIQHAVLWQNGKIMDIAPAGLAGSNSGAFGVNATGLAMGLVESSAKDPNNENFCGYGTGLKCLPFLWQNGVATLLPTLGGNNAAVGQINNLGQLAGYAETGAVDPNCPAGMAANGTGPQVLDFEAVIWGPGPGQLRQLAPLPGDSVGIATWINDNGQAVGISGSCGNTVMPPFTAGPHAVFWDSDGSVHDLGNLGGTISPGVLAVGNAANAINNQGQVVGISALPGNKTGHPFLWTSPAGMRDLGLLSGDAVGAGLAINNAGQVVGASISPPGPPDGNPRAFLWQKGVMADLNTLVQANAPLYLLTAFAINDVGQIAGFGVTDAGDIHGFLATPVITIAVAGSGATASATSFETVTNQIALDASKSTSANAGALQYSWTSAPGYQSAAILGAATATPLIQMPTRGMYQFVLTVTDARGVTATATIAIRYI